MQEREDRRVTWWAGGWVGGCLRGGGALVLVLVLRPHCPVGTLSHSRVRVRVRVGVGVGVSVGMGVGEDEDVGVGVRVQRGLPYPWGAPPCARPGRMGPETGPGSASIEHYTSTARISPPPPFAQLWRSKSLLAQLLYVSRMQWVDVSGEL